MPPDVCKTCGGAELRKVCQSVTEVLAYVPARFEVIRHVRQACWCRKCETMMQAPMLDMPIPRGIMDASFLTHIVVAKSCDYIPFYHQAEIYARDGSISIAATLSSSSDTSRGCCGRSASGSPGS